MKGVRLPATALEYFCVLAEELHYSRAAARLHISAPSLSQQISRLERQIGVQLFERSPRAVRITSAGAELLPLAEEVCAARKAADAWADSIRNRGRTTLRVGIVVPTAWATRLLQTAAETMPNTDWRVVKLGFNEESDALREDRIDIAIAVAPVDSTRGLRIMPLFSERRVLVMPKGHRFAGRGSVDIDELNDEVFAAPAGEDRQALSWWLVDPRPDGSRVRRGPVADEFEGVLELVSAGLAVNIAGESAMTHARRDDIAFAFIDGIPDAAIVMCRRAEERNPAVLEFERLAAQLSQGRGPVTP